MPLKIKYISDIVGLVVLIMLVAIMSIFVPESVVPRFYWIAIYLIWAACALFVWHKYKALEPASHWLLVAVYSVIGAPLWYGASIVIARIVFGNTEPELSKVFDVLVALMIAPGLTFIAITGWVRAFIHARWMQ